MKIFILEDHVMFREVIRKACSRQLRHEVVGESGSGLEALQLIVKLRPELLLLDLSLPDLSGLEVARVVRPAVPTMKTVVLSCHVDAHTVHEVERVGVEGFVDKTSSTVSMLGDALADIAGGRTYFSPAFKAAQRAHRRDQQSADKLLSDTERRVLSFIGHGLSDEEIGQRLGITRNTAQTHRSHILRKLRVGNSARLAAYAVRHGFTLYS
ncbi:response regulator [Opitutus terrae]|uniref:Two component transcriptional regulator, LuxR family n=1 Tax=Opitutus terrae (strain DSM 11246 / JCM 15787 / PB90-1) TaxID=452637 RepID=B1ZPR9_OPITP|nr:response regulator transcription factor [Opitutus terrae]ACB75522.1 two component transcriptional regulator, LuxR family [Opitutus terrae PB90-1]